MQVREGDKLILMDTTHAVRVPSEQRPRYNIDDIIRDGERLDEEYLFSKWTVVETIDSVSWFYPNIIARDGANLVLLRFNDVIILNKRGLLNRIILKNYSKDREDGLAIGIAVATEDGEFCRFIHWRLRNIANDFSICNSSTNFVIPDSYERWGDIGIEEKREFQKGIITDPSQISPLILSGLRKFWFKGIAHIEKGHTVDCGECLLPVHRNYDSVMINVLTSVEYCGRCAVEINIPCSLCGVSFELRDYLNNPIGTDSIIYILENNIEYLCRWCSSHVTISCSVCDSVEFIELCYGNRDEMERNFDILENSFSIFNGDMHCKVCYNRAVSMIFDEPYRRLSPGNFQSSTFGKYDLKRHIGIENEVISDELQGADMHEHSFEDFIYIPVGWNAVYDGSLSDGGVEYRTHRPIQGDLIEKRVESLTRSIADQYMYTDKSCGLHLHFNAVDMGIKSMKALLKVMFHMEPIILKTLPSHRVNNRYCISMHDKLAYKDIENIENVGDLTKLFYNQLGNTQIDTSHYNSARYLGLNLHARFYLGSIEFRYHEGTDDYESIMGWINFCRRIIEASNTLATGRPKSKFKRMKKLFETKNKDILWGCLTANDYDKIDAIGGSKLMSYVEKRTIEHTKGENR